MKLDQTKEEKRVCQYILAYLLENPQAGDTLDGIVEWWLLNQRIGFETKTVSQAIAKLVADGLIVEQQVTGSRIIYRANRTSGKLQAVLNEMRSLSDE